MKISWIFIWVLLSGCAGCGPEINNNITIKDDINECAPACAHLQKLGCDEGKDLIFPETCTVDTDTCSSGVCVEGYCTETCEMFCKAMVTEGRELGLECWQVISKCSEIESVCR